MSEHQTSHHLRDLADPSVETLIMVPGLDGTAKLFYRQLPLLARHFNVVAFPLPDKRNASMDELVQDLAELVREVSNGRAILCGESFGGALSMSLALRHPELVRGLVIVNSFPYLENRIELALAPRVAKLIPWGFMPFVRRFTEFRLHSAHAAEEDLLEFRERMRGVQRDGYIRRLELVAQFDIRSRLRDIDAPTLFLAGTADKLIPSARWADYMADRVPGAEAVMLEGYGHCCMIDFDLDLGNIVGEWWTRTAKLRR